MLKLTALPALVCMEMEKVASGLQSRVDPTHATAPRAIFSPEIEWSSITLLMAVSLPGPLFSAENNNLGV